MSHTPLHDTQIPPIIVARERALLAPYAMHSVDSAGRVHAEPPHPYRGPFQRDRDRVIHSAAFRRLSYKTQVFTGELGDYHRTRLTHTLEVASLARTIARALRLNEDLVEALALAHDIGHPPFGHAGEDALDECLADGGGFNHNQQALRIVEHLEMRYTQYPGLNLTQEVLAGQRARIDKNLTARDGRLLEAQVVDAADSAAYDTHDADDALELGLVEFDELLELTLWREAAKRVRTQFANLAPGQQRRAVVHQILDHQVNDLLTTAGARLDALQPSTAAVAAADNAIITPSAELAEKKHIFEQFLHEHVYRHPTVLAMRAQAQAALQEMFAYFVAHDGQLPAKFRDRITIDGQQRAICDYLAGMTDRFALQEHSRLAVSILTLALATSARASGGNLC